MFKLFCFGMLNCLVISVLITYIKYFHYFRVVLKRVNKRVIKKNKVSCIKEKVYIYYRFDYYGFQSFTVPYSKYFYNMTFYPDYYFRLFGYLHNGDTCKVLVKGNKVLSILVIKDIQYFKNIELYFIKVFRICFILFIGGIVLWLSSTLRILIQELLLMV